MAPPQGAGPLPGWARISDSRKSSADLRTIVLDAGLTALAELTPTDLVRAIGMRAVARRAGVSSSALFRQFPTLEVYASALVEHLYSSTEEHASNELVDDIVRNDYPAEAAMRLHDHDIRRSAERALKNRAADQLSVLANGASRASSSHDFYIRCAALRPR